MSWYKTAVKLKLRAILTNFDTWGTLVSLRVGGERGGEEIDMIASLAFKMPSKSSFTSDFASLRAERRISASCRRVRSVAKAFSILITLQCRASTEES